MNGDIFAIRRNIVDGSIDESIAKLILLAKEMNLGEAFGELESVKATYVLMKQYMLTGYEDSQREKLYGDIKLRVFEISSVILVHVYLAENNSFRYARNMAANNPIQLEDVERKLSWFVQELALNSLGAIVKGNNGNIHESQFEYREKLFNYIYTSIPFSTFEEEYINRILLSPVIDVVDAKLIISAIMLAQQLVFDIRKFKILIKVCIESLNEEVRQYALIAIVLGRPDEVEQNIYNTEIEQEFEKLSTISGFMEDLVELQVQILLCTDTEKTEKTIAEEIMPTLKSGAVSFNKPKDDKDMLDELLHPDKEDNAMEEMEKSVEKMKNMQKTGADIFFGGFSQAKRFSFFYTLMNWFVPFYVEHPHIASVNIGDIPKNIIEKLLDGQAFCNSDKYSFYLTLSMVSSQIPKEFIDVLSKGEVVPEFGNEIKNDKTYKRLIYLQDIYRFYKLYNNKVDFKDPFASDETAVFFNWVNIVNLFKNTNYPYKIARQLLSRDYFNSLHTLLENNKDELNISYVKLKGISSFKQENYTSALYWFEKARLLEPDNRLLLQRIADIAFQAGDYFLAQQSYEEILELADESENTDVQSYKLGLCYLQHKNIEGAKKILFKLYFSNENNINYKSSIAWLYILSSNYENAVSIYDSIELDLIGDKDLVRKALTLWYLKKRTIALEEFKLYVKRSDKKAIDLIDELILEQKQSGINISHTELKIIVDIVFDKSLYL